MLYWLFDDSENRRRRRSASLFSESCWFVVACCLDVDGELIEDVDELEAEELDEGRDDAGML